MGRDKAVDTPDDIGNWWARDPLIYGLVSLS
jgi:hypothetical protein